ncbi:unnamed protein product [Hymenolepis diminuta]|uniref:G_PROTEIN_RECEP_F1_2 domain-containing protein n=1 Tax=Hymenolepis diminuta TaxID=6216 RepID=A0A0R3S957_HYMDI|nr:unnamed protein product [Hymenolepis diminuta]
MNDYKEEDIFWRVTNVSDEMTTEKIVVTCFECLAILPNILLFILLLRLQGRTRTSLLMFRFITFCNCIYVFVCNLQDVLLGPLFKQGSWLGYFFCGLFKSFFIPYTFYNISSLSLVYFAIYRTMQITENLQLSFTQNLGIDVLTIVYLVIYSLLMAIPHTLFITYAGDGCYYTASVLSGLALRFIYAQIYVYFFQFILFNNIVLLACSYLLIRWVRKTPKKDFFDTLNELHFPGTSEEELHLFKRDNSWSTASMAIVPLTFLYTISTMNRVYKFIASLGIVTYEIGSPYYRIAKSLMLVGPSLCPYILFFHIPALRFWTKKRFFELIQIILSGINRLPGKEK